LVDAPPERVFTALLDPDVVAGAIPVIRSHREVDVDHWEAKVKAPIPLAPSVTIRFEVLEKRPPEHASIHSRGGGADVASSFDLEPIGDDATRVRWHAEIELHGILGAFAGHGLEPLARRAAERVLDRVSAAAAT
jgi:carbon monoxide dehydrogenase subunit G